MNVATISVPMAEARKKRDAYERRLRRMAASNPHYEEYRDCQMLYWHLAQGKTLIDVEDAIRNAPRDAKGRPMLAIARADRRQVECQRRPESVTFDASALFNGAGNLIERIGGMERTAEAWARGYSLVPLIPADVRPDKGHPRDWHILWEVEGWSDRRLDAEPDRDPYLLRRVSGMVFEVLAEWDLTEIEQRAMRSRVLG